MLAVDLALAGIAYTDEFGRVADFHSLRSSYVSMLVRGGASARVTQDLARHSDPRLTLRIYAQAGTAEGRAALEAPPALVPFLVLPAQSRRTDGDAISCGTDGGASPACRPAGYHRASVNLADGAGRCETPACN
jgi:hypothetical protein